MQEEIKYLGFLCSKDGLRIDPERIKQVVRYPVPRNLKQLQARTYTKLWTIHKRICGNNAADVSHHEHKNTLRMVQGMSINLRRNKGNDDEGSNPNLSRRQSKPRIIF